MIFTRSLICTFKRYSSYSSKVRVRFAPSPTGFLHLGGLRTAFFNYLFAKKTGGKFILRIEDTDQKRVKPGSVENLNAMLEWTGLIPDESPIKGGSFGPYVQSERLKIYKEKIEFLLKNNAAYRCFCSETRLNVMKRDALKRNESRGYDNKCRHLKPSEIEKLLKEATPYVVRFKIPDKSVSHDDIVFGNQTYNVADNEGDFVILKSDGFPTYHFACVIDDHLMEISHVLRGTEWLISTPKHLMLHDAFSWTPPKYAHLPLLTNSDRTKLSKRQEAIGIDYFKNKSYFPEALLSFLAMAGGGFGKQEGCIAYDLETLCSKFNLEQVNKNSCIVDFRKLDLLNQNYITQKLSSDESFAELIKDFRQILKSKFGKRYEEETNLTDYYLKKVLLCYKDRMTTLLEMADKEMEYLWISPKYENVMQLLSDLKIPDSIVCSMKDVHHQLSLLPTSEFNQEILPSKLKEISSVLKVKYVVLMRVIRVIVTGQKDGPGVAEILSMLGKEKSLENLSIFIKEIEERESKIFL